MIRESISKVVDGIDLSQEEAAATMNEIMHERDRRQDPDH